MTRPDGIFVRAIWGEDSYPIRAKIEREATQAAQCPIKIDTLWYCYGLNNQAFLQSLGIKPILLDEEPIHRFGRKGPRNDSGHQVFYGVSQWLMKYKPLEHALAGYEDACWLDMDTLPCKPIPPDFWQRMRRGREFQCCLQQNTRKRAGWRGPDVTPEQFAALQKMNKRIALLEKQGPSIELEELKAERRRIDREPRKTPCGSLMYFRGSGTVQRFIALYNQRPAEWDLSALARFTDELWGGWQHSTEYKAAGFEPWCHSVGRQVYQPEDVIFKSGWKRGLRAVALGRAA